MIVTLPRDSCFNMLGQIEDIKTNIAFWLSFLAGAHVVSVISITHASPTRPPVKKAYYFAQV